MKKKLKWLLHEDLTMNIQPTINRNEYLSWMTFGESKTVPFTEMFGPMVGVKEDWEQQGATPEELNFSAFSYQSPKVFTIPVNTGRINAFQELIEETENEIHYRDDLGRTLVLHKGVATIPLPMNYPVKNMEDWLKIKPNYQYLPNRLSSEIIQSAIRARENNYALAISIPGAFDEPRQLMGEEALCYAYFDQEELIDDMLSTFCATSCMIISEIVKHVPIDILFVHDDMAGKSGSLAGPNQIKKFIYPYYRKVWDLMKNSGASLFMQDSDGDLNSILDSLIECGINCISPAEPRANMDIVMLRQKYGKSLTFFGGIDKYVLQQSKSEITKELEYKIPPMINSKGCVLALDHRIPNGVSIENYRFYIQEVHRIINQNYKANTQKEK